MTQEPESARHLVYFADPMCSWCWGFAPVISAIAEHFGERLPITLVVGGLRPGTTSPMSDAMKREIRTHWEHVAERTGQPFDFAFFERKNFVYDTEPADRAAVVAALLNPRLALSYFTSIQRAFYAENRDVTDAATLASLAADHGMDAAQFSAALATEEARRATQRDFEIARSSGVKGFPTIFAGDPQSGYALVTSGYRPLDGLTDILEDWLAQA